MGKNYMPSNDLQFQSWLGKFMTYMSANLAHLGLTADAVADLVATGPEFNMARAEFDAARTTAKGLCAAKDAKRGEIEPMVRRIVGIIQANPATTDQDRDELGLPARETGMSVQSVGGSGNRPTVTVVITQGRQHKLRIRNVNPEGTIEDAKPAGVDKAEIWVKVGEPAQTDDQYKYLGTTSRSPYFVNYTSEDVNKPAHYMVRWMDHSGQTGIWSEVETATIAA